jgi:hypothetical protein
VTGAAAAPEAPRVHAIVYSWPKVHENAFAIATALEGSAARVSVVACTDEPLEHAPSLEVFLLDNSCFFGRQFEKTIEVFDGDVLLQIAADTTTASWPSLAQQCAKRFQDNPALGVWTPDIDGTTWPNERVTLYQTQDPTLIGVVQTDCIVWAIRRPIVDYLKTLDYSATPLGWGIDWAAIAHAHANNQRVVRDLAVKIHHRIGGSGYDRFEADRQRNLFLSRIPDDDKVQLYLLYAVVSARALAQQQS